MKENTALSGLKVLDFTRVYSGPYCTMLLADLGAEVTTAVPAVLHKTPKDVPNFMKPMLCKRHSMYAYPYAQ